MVSLDKGNVLVQILKVGDGTTHTPGIGSDWVTKCGLKASTKEWTPMKAASVTCSLCK